MHLSPTSKLGYLSFNEAVKVRKTISVNRCMNDEAPHR